MQSQLDAAVNENVTLKEAAAQSGLELESLKQSVADATSTNQSLNETLASTSSNLEAVNASNEKLQKRLQSLEDSSRKHKAQKRKESEEKRAQMFKSYFQQNQVPPLLSDQVRPRTVVEELGKGYSAKESQQNFRNHTNDVEDEIIRKAGRLIAFEGSWLVSTTIHCLVTSGGDPLKQLQLADGVLSKFKGIKSTFVKEQQALNHIQEGLRTFYTYLATTYCGRYPNKVRAMWQAVNSSISCAAPDGSLTAIANAVSANPAALAAGRKHWMEWVAGDREAVMDLRGERHTRLL